MTEISHTPIEQTPLCPVFIVGISGKIGAGKTTQVDKLLSALGEQHKLGINFADKLKADIRFHAGLSEWHTNTHAGKETLVPGYGSLTVGQMLQHWGGGLRHKMPFVWIAPVGQAIEAERRRGDPTKELFVVIGDVRNPNECRWINENGGVVVRLIGDPGGVRAKSTRDHNDETETALDHYVGFDLVVDTDKNDIDATHAKIMALVNSQ